MCVLDHMARLCLNADHKTSLLKGGIMSVLCPRCKSKLERQIISSGYKYYCQLCQIWKIGKGRGKPSRWLTKEIEKQNKIDKMMRDYYMKK
jgi:hypothetical protein